MLRAACLGVTLIVVFAGRAGAQTTPVLIDRNMTVGAGATVSAAAGETIARAEAHVVPVRLFEEDGVARRSANVAYRIFKLGLFDLAQERFVQVANHEIFGHGGRLRERFHAAISYGVDVPPPYGPGGGVTSFELDRDPTAYEAQAVNAGGMEADGVAAALTFRRAVDTRRTTPREAMRYLLFELDTLRYIRLTGDGPHEPGQDVGDWIDGYHEIATSVGAPQLRARTLRREALVSLANPMLAYAAFAIGRYVWNGSTEDPVPMIHLGSLRYLPMLRYRLAPYGTEMSIVNELAGASEHTELTARVGRAPASVPWGFGILREGIAGWRGWRIDGRANVWRQPALVGDPLEIDPAMSRVGVDVGATGERPLIPVWFGAGRASVIVDVAVKSRGYLAGEPLDRGVVVRAGVGLPF